MHSATAPRCLERQPQRSAMLSLSEVPYCESAVMKTRLSCHESARMSAAAATGSIGSIFDVSMTRGGRQQGSGSLPGRVYVVGGLALARRTDSRSEVVRQVDQIG